MEMVTHIYPLIVDLPILTHIYMVIFHSYLCLPKANHQPAVTFQSHGQGQAPEEIGHGFRLGGAKPSSTHAHDGKGAGYLNSWMVF